jgi:hypothetical protein
MRTNRFLVVVTVVNITLVNVGIASCGVRNAQSQEAAPDVVRARAIELVDANGAVRAQLNVEPGGQAVFRIRDEAGQIRVKLGADGRGSGLVLMNATSEPGVQVLAQESASMKLKNPDGKEQLLTPP